MNNKNQHQDIVALEIISELHNYCNYIFSSIESKIYGKKVLDFGCGFGDFCKYLKYKKFNIEGFEPNNVAFEKASNKNIKIYQRLNQINGKYTTVTSLNVLEHIEDDKKALSNIKDLLDTEGRLILYLPAKMFLWSQMDVLANHYRRYEKSEIISKLEIVGFKIESIEYFDFIGWLVLTIFKLFKIKPKFNKKIIIFYDKFIFKNFKILDILFKKIVGKNLLISAIYNKN